MKAKELISQLQKVVDKNPDSEVKIACMGESNVRFVKSEFDIVETGPEDEMPEIWLEIDDTSNIDNEIKSEVKSVKKILEQIPEDIRKRLCIDEWDDGSGFQIDGLETVIAVRNPVDIRVHKFDNSEQEEYIIKTKNGGEFIVHKTGGTYLTIT